MTDGETPTEILKEEHQHVLQKLDALEEIFGSLDKKDRVSAELTELASFFKTDFWVHFTKEEEALFPEIDKFIPRESGPLGVMLIEHEDLRNINTEFQQVVDAYLGNSGNSETEEMIQRHGNHFIGILRDHIDKEDNILFAMANAHLEEIHISQIIKLFNEIERG